MTNVDYVGCGGNLFFIAPNSQIYEHFVLQIYLIMQKYTKIKVIRTTEIQHQTLQKMKSMGIDVCRFIRDAISEKIEREKIEILKHKIEKCPF